MKSIAILGSTGSIGTQALDVVSLHKDKFRIAALTAKQNAELLFEQVRTHRPQLAGLIDPPSHIPEDVRFCQWVFGEDCLKAAATLPDVDHVLVSVVGVAGLPSVLHALSAGHSVLLANKEALVAGGALVMDAARKAGKPLLPVDSEHSAIFQCLQGAQGNPLRRILLTASGGPFRTAEPEAIERATVAQALRHPNWAMGRKISIDSATMMNKALEVIEARWLFDVQPEQIEVLIHKESIVHSMVEYIDGSVIAQLGNPDMRLPILYAMSYPDRLETGGEPLDLTKLSGLTFESPDSARFPALSLAYDALRAGGTACAVLNAANECAVEAFLQERIPFGHIHRIARDVLSALPAHAVSSLDDVLIADKDARDMAERLLRNVSAHI